MKSQVKRFQNHLKVETKIKRSLDGVTDFHIRKELRLGQFLPRSVAIPVSDALKDQFGIIPSSTKKL